MGNTQSSAGVLQQMQAVADAKTTGRLVLSHMDLETIPDLEDCGPLHTLELASNHLSTIPPSIPSHPLLSSLAVLDLSHNLLSLLPPSFTSLQALMKLDLSHNNLKDLGAVSFSQGLQIVYAGNNKIEGIERATIEGARALQVLDLNHNLISEITALHHLNNIISLDLGHNGIREVPAQFYTLQNLEVLNFQNNAIESLPKGISKLRKLLFLFLQSNKLKALPNDIGELKYLQTLNIKDNDISMLPLTLGRQIKHLKDLKLDGMIIYHQMVVPPSIIRKQGTIAVLAFLNQEREALEKLHADRNNKKLPPSKKS